MTPRLPLSTDDVIHHRGWGTPSAGPAHPLLRTLPCQGPAQPKTPAPPHKRATRSHQVGTLASVPDSQLPTQPPQGPRHSHFLLQVKLFLLSPTSPQEPWRGGQGGASGFSPHTRHTHTAHACTPRSECPRPPSSCVGTIRSNVMACGGVLRWAAVEDRVTWCPQEWNEGPQRRRCQEMICALRGRGSKKVPCTRREAALPRPAPTPGLPASTVSGR